MADPNALALSVAQPNVDIITPMKSLAELQNSQAQASLHGAQARYQNMRQNALAQYAAEKAKGNPNALDIIAGVDPVLAKEMQSYEWTGKEQRAQEKAGDRLRAGDEEGADAEIANFQNLRQVSATTKSTMNNAQKTEFEMKADMAGRTANKFLEAYRDYSAGKIPFEDYRQEWNKGLYQLFKAGVISKADYNFRFDNPDPATARTMRAYGLSAREGTEYTGDAAANKSWAELTPAQAKARYEKLLDVWKTQSETKVVPGNAAVRQGGQDQPPEPMDIRSPYDQPRPVKTETIRKPAAPGETSPRLESTDPLVKQMPVQQLSKQSMGQRGPDGSQWVTPPNPEYLNKLRTDSVEAFNKTTGAEGHGAEAMIDQLSRLEDTIQKTGGLKTDKFAEARMELAGYIYAATGNYDFAKRLTNIDLPDAASFDKEARRLGLTYARQTEGAREAVQAIKIALGANPQITNDKEGNLKIIRTMKEIAEWQKDKAAAGQLYANKQATDPNGEGFHYVGFDQWWNKTHPLITYTSKAAPLERPADNSKLIKDVTYQTPMTTEQYERTFGHGPAKSAPRKKIGDNTMIIVRGVWDGENFMTSEPR